MAGSTQQEFLQNPSSGVVVEFLTNGASPSSGVVQYIKDSRHHYWAVSTEMLFLMAQFDQAPWAVTMLVYGISFVIVSPITI